MSSGLIANHFIKTLCARNLFSVVDFMEHCMLLAMTLIAHIEEKHPGRSYLTQMSLVIWIGDVQMPFESCFGLTVKRYVDGKNDLIGAEEYKNKT